MFCILVSNGFKWARCSSFSFLFKKIFMHLFLTVLGLSCSMQTLHWSKGRASLYVLPGA